MAERELLELRRPRLYQVRVPLPFLLRYVNSYVFIGSDGLTVIDPGLRTAEALACWDEALARLGASKRDIRRIVLTHHHPDHIGLAGLFQQESGAETLLSVDGVRQAESMWSGERPMGRMLPEAFARHGMDDETVALIREHMAGFVQLVSPLPRTSPLEDGDRVSLGDELFTAIHTPGHAWGHMMLLHEESGELLCGDHVLPKITPNIGWLPGVDESPLASYIAALRSVAALPVTRAYPGHREPFDDWAGRCRELLAHHEERLAAFAAAVSSRCTAYEACRRTFGSRLSPHQLRFAMAETLAHLFWLRDAGRLKEEQDEAAVYFAPVSAL